VKVSLNWIKDYIDLKGIPTKEIVGKLTMSGIEVEEYFDENEVYKDFVVGFVKDKKKHPNADKLSVCIVNDGKEDLQVICGAPNVEGGQKVVFSPIGTIIPKGNFKISKAKIRGVESFGMICAEDELGISDDHSGIMILDNKLKEGTPLTKALGLDDVILEIAITPNRSDALSHIGVARDLAAIFGKKLTLPKIELSESSEKIEDNAQVEIIDSKNCPRYTAKVVKNITIKESPGWLKQRLTKIGLRPINNIVDVTNYVMYETGQPLHAFDLDLLQGKKIVVKSTKEVTSFTTLDSKERKLAANTLLICDGKKPVAVAGVMGGENSEINNKTKNILIESAYFDPVSIRNSSKAIGLSTDASYRFERGIDPNGTLYSAERAAQLIAELSDGQILKGTLDIYHEHIENKEVMLRFSRITKLLGYKISKENVSNIIARLGFKILAESEDELRLSIPTYRPDIEREVDIIEEIARINGYNNIPTISKISVTLDKKTDESSFADKIREIATGLGFYEMINNPLQSENLASISGNKIGILNPQSQDMAYLRTSLIPGALSVVSQNIKFGEKNLSFFEIGNVFNLNEDSVEIKNFDDFTEKQTLLFLTTGNIEEKSWNSPEIKADFYTLKGVIDSFLSKVSLDNVTKDSYYHSENTIFDFYYAKILNNSVLGQGGKVKKTVLKKFDIQQDVFCFEFDIYSLRNIDVNEKRYKQPLKFPKAIRDFAFIFDNSVTYGEVNEYIKKDSLGLLKSVSLFDLFENESLGKNKKSMAFTLEFYSEERTLTEEEVEKEFNHLIASVTKKFNAKLRG
jgi:phenylalanyl-tRNA synthetase beta chain